MAKMSRDSIRKRLVNIEMLNFRLAKVCESADKKVPVQITMNEMMNIYRDIAYLAKFMLTLEKQFPIDNELIKRLGV